MRNAKYYNKPLHIRIAVTLFLFCFALFIHASNEEKKLRILQNMQKEIKKEVENGQQATQIITTLDSVFRLKTISDSDFSRITYQIGELFREQGMLTPAIELFFSVISYFEQVDKSDCNKTETLIRFYIPLGASHEELGMWNRAMGFYLKALNLADELNIDSYKAMIYNNIGAIHYNRTESEKAEIYVRKALEINLKNNNRKELFNNYNNLAGIYFNKKKFDQALDCALKAIQVLNSEKDTYLYYFMQTNIATLYLQKKDYKLAVSYLRNAMIHQEQFRFTYDLVQTYYILARTFSELNHTDSAQFYIDKTLKQVKKIQNKHLEGRILNDISEHYTKNNDFKKAYRALYTATLINDSIQQVDNRKRMDDLEKVYDADKKIKENEILIKEISLKKTASDRLWIIMFSIALLLIIAILFIINRTRSKEKIRKADEMVIQQKAILYEKENELQKQKEQELNNTIDQKNRELTSYTLHMVKANEFTADLAEELKQLLLEINPRDKAHKDHVRQILSKLHHQNYTTTNWDEFRCYFEQVHPSFYDNLENFYPDLTMKEKRLCAFLRLGLSTKEISAITFKEVRSVESARNRLRKKLNLPLEDNLTDFLCYNIHLNSIQEHPTEKTTEENLNTLIEQK